MDSKHAPSILPFRSSPSAAVPATPALVQADAVVTHDIAALRRPVPVPERQATPAVRSAAGLAHDARNVFASLELLSSLLAEPGVLGAGHEGMAEDLRSLSGVLQGLVEQMVAGPDAGVVVRREPVRVRTMPVAAAPPVVARPGVVAAPGGDAGAAIKACERLLGAIAGPGVTLQVKTERGIAPLAMPNDELTRVLINLVRNAGEAMPFGGRVTVEVRKAMSLHPAACITVSDTGCGIPAHALGQIFQAGFTSKRPAGSWPAGEHHGLGLTIVRDLVEAAGGSVRVTSTLKKGTTFEIKLPCCGM